MNVKQKKTAEELISNLKKHSQNIRKLASESKGKYYSDSAAGKVIQLVDDLNAIRQTMLSSDFSFNNSISIDHFIKTLKSVTNCNWERLENRGSSSLQKQETKRRWWEPQSLLIVASLIAGVGLAVWVFGYLFLINLACRIGFILSFFGLVESIYLSGKIILSRFQQQEQPINRDDEQSERYNRSDELQKAKVKFIQTYKKFVCFVEQVFKENDRSQRFTFYEIRQLLLNDSF